MAVRTLKVTVVGAGGGIGQPLSLLIRRCPGIDELALHDLSEMKGIAADLSHVSQRGKVIAFTGEEELEPALTRADVVGCGRWNATSAGNAKGSLDGRQWQCGSQGGNCC